MTANIRTLGSLGIVFILEIVIAQSAQAASWKTNSPMATARQFHTATLLTNGLVLVAGGENAAFETIATTELYNPDTAAWQPTGTMNGARLNHTATLLPNGEVLVVGGINGDYLDTAEIYNPLSGLWSSTSPMTNARSKHTATLLPNGKVLVAGGSGGNSDHDAEIYDPSLGTWTPANPMIYARSFHSATLLANGKVLIAGGRGDANSEISAELYDPATGVWTSTGNLNLPREFHSAALLQNGKVLVVAGWQMGAELYNPVTETWAPAGEIDPWLPVFGHSLTVLPNGKALLASGFSQGFGGVTDPRAWLFDPTNTTWAQTVSLNAGRYVHTATLLQDGQVLVIGGGGENPSRLASMETYLYLDPIVLAAPVLLPNGGFQFTFTNTPGAGFNTLATTNLATPLSTWTTLGGVTEISSGQFQFTDTQTTNSPQRFYRVRAN